ncbi:MAG: DUF937 domain-containing protein [Chitinophagales bacterium]|nr:DUF937 domain-containing protein [Chitinophagales bacterium]
MSFNILDSVMNMITPNHIDNLSSHLGESNTAVTKAMGVAVPAIIAGLIHKVERGEGSSLLNEVMQAGKNPEYTNPAGLFNSPGSGSTSLLGSIFGGGHSAITDAVGRHSGIKSSSASSLLSMLAPIVIGLLGRHATTNNLSSGSLSSLLTEHKEKVAAAMPAGFSIPALLGLNSNRNTETYTNTTSAPVNKAKPNRTVPILIGLAALALLLYFLSQGLKNKDNTPVTTIDTTTTMIKAAPVTTERETMKVKLADGTELDAYKGGIEDQLVACLNDDACKAGKDKWFDFDNINFEMGSASLTSESKSQLNNIDMILKAYPKVKIKIGGYTDNTGDAAVNQKLSEDRAQTVASALKADGSVASQVTGAEGYGSQFAKMPATASDEERKTDRRISVQLVAK